MVVRGLVEFECAVVVVSGKLLIETGRSVPISCMSKRKYFHMTRESEKTFTFYTTTPINCMGYGKRLAAMLSEKRDSHTANDGVDVMPLELCLLRASILCLSGAI